MPRIGLISDTHGLLRPQALAALAGCRHIIHGGDIGGPEVLAQLETLAPLSAVRGNNDHGPWAQALPLTRTLVFGAVRIHVLHDLADLDIDPAVEGIGEVVCGHSHKPRVEDRGGVLIVNPGSAGPRRFSLPVTVAELALHEGRVQARILPLDIATTPKPAAAAPPAQGRVR